MVNKRGKSLTDQLVHSYLAPPQSMQAMLAPIPKGQPPPWLLLRSKHPYTGKEIPIKGVVSCHTKSVIYLIAFPCG